MEFIEISKDRYLLKNSNSMIFSKKEMLELQKKELVIKDVTSNECQGETTQEISKINEELENTEETKKAKKSKKK